MSRTAILYGHRFHLLLIASAIVAGIVPSPASADPNVGIASVYSNEPTANGEYASADGLTAAHRTFSFGTMVEVTNTTTGLSVVVRINDRGPFVRGRVIDLTPAGARAIGSPGLAPVTLRVISIGIPADHAAKAADVPIAHRGPAPDAATETAVAN
jgi:rare lipoprotein A